MEYKNPSPSVDVIIERDGRIVLIKRRKEPFKNMLALPRGFVEHEETVEHAVIREAEEETGLKIKIKEILGVYSDPNRNPIRHTMTTVFVAEPIGGELKAGTDASEAKWFDLKEIENLAFDHVKILRDYVKWKEEKGTFWSSK